MKHICSALLSLTFLCLLTGCESDYVKRDRQGQTIDCQKMVDHDDIAAIEYQTGYRFTQCRAEIELQKSRQCDQLASHEFYGSANQDNDIDKRRYQTSAERCGSSSINQYLVRRGEQFKTLGHALIVDGEVYPREMIRLKKLHRATTPYSHVTYYSLAVINEHFIVGQFIYPDLDSATKAGDKLTSLIAGY